MKQPRKYTRRAQHYRVLAQGYAALKSSLAGPAQAAAEAFEHMAGQPSGVTRAAESGRNLHEEWRELAGPELHS